MTPVAVREDSVGPLRAAEADGVDVLHLVQVVFVVAVLIELLDVFHLTENRGACEVLSGTRLKVALRVAEASHDINGFGELLSLAAWDAPGDKRFLALGRTELPCRWLRQDAIIEIIITLPCARVKNSAFAGDASLCETVGDDRVIAEFL